MRALRLLEWKSDPVLVDVPEPTPGPGQVVVRVGGAGACHSDLHLMHDFSPGLLPWGLPFTLGHENAGWVHALGDGVSGLEVGRPVAVYGAWGCGTCSRCLLGMENYCENPQAAPVPGGGGGLGADVVLDFVGSQDTLALAGAVTRVMGDLTIVGIASGTLPVSFFSVPYEASIQTTYWGSRPELAEVLTLAARGLVRPRVTTFGLDQAVSAYQQLESRRLDGRAVILPSSA